MRSGLTQIQRRALDFIRSYMLSHNYVSPSFDEIKDALSLRSKSGVHRIVHGLASRGHISLMRDRARSISLEPDYRELATRLAGKIADADEVGALILAREVLSLVEVPQ